MANQRFSPITCDTAPRCIGSYSQAMMVSGVLFISGQIGLCPVANELVGKDLASQTKQAMENIKAILSTCSMDLSSVAKITVYLTDMCNYDEFNKIYASYFTEPLPARTVVAVSALPKGAVVEIDALSVYVDKQPEEVSE